MPPPVMCAMPLIQPRRAAGDDLQIRPVRREQRLADRLAELGNVAVVTSSQHVERDLARQRVAVGVQARRRQRDQDVAGLDRRGRR